MLESLPKSKVFMFNLKGEFQINPDPGITFFYYVNKTFRPS